MTDLRETYVARRLAERVSITPHALPPVEYDESPIPEGLLDCLREHLATGETHYTARPGIKELRDAIGHEIGRIGGMARESDGVIVTHGEGEALYVTLLGLGLSSASKLAVHGQCRHGTLLDLLGIAAVGVNKTESANADATYREIAEEGAGGARVAGGAGDTGSERFEIASLGDLLFSAGSHTDALQNMPDSAIIIGSLDSVPGLDHFRLGFVAGPPDLVKRIQKWKQALSICTAGPSQRAALYAIEGRSTS
jgi:aspartate/methionine/tyrosine aminotransferase